MPRVSAILSAWNEEQFLPQVLTSLQKQSLPLSEVSIVDDGSMDRTGNVARSFGALVSELPYHPHRLFKEPGGLAKRFNKALEKLQPCDYILILGSDDVLLSERYVEVLVNRLEADSRLVVASGQMHGHPSDPLTPRGSGRLVKTWFWQMISNMRFPVLGAWEEHMVYAALLNGFKAKAFNDVEFQSLRGGGVRRPLKAFGDGMAMYSLGYFWVYAVLRVATTFLSAPKEAYFLACGYLVARRRRIKQTDFADRLSAWQKWQLAHGKHVQLWRKFTRKTGLIVKLRKFAMRMKT